MFCYIFLMWIFINTNIFCFMIRVHCLTLIKLVDEEDRPNALSMLTTDNDADGISNARKTRLLTSCQSAKSQYFLQKGDQFLYNVMGVSHLTTCLVPNTVAQTSWVQP